MEYGKFVKAAALSGLAVIVLTGNVYASPLLFSLYDPDPQPLNGTIGSAALSQRTPGGSTPIMNELTGRGYPDTAAQYDPKGKLYLPPTAPVSRDNRAYFHRRSTGPAKLVPPVVVHVNRK